VGIQRLLCRGSLAVASDSFGRVLLIDVISLTVIRIWKSYRDAQFGWVMCTWQQQRPEQQHSVDEPTQPQPHAGKRRRADAEPTNKMQDDDDELDKSASLHLLLYAPRRRALELWQMRHGPRVATAQVPNACKLLQRVVPFGLEPGGVQKAGTDSCSKAAVQAANQCLILDTSTGQSTDALAVLQQTSQTRAA